MAQSKETVKIMSSDKVPYACTLCDDFSGVASDEEHKGFLLGGHYAEDHPEVWAHLVSVYRPLDEAGGER